jgi:transcriptional regulator of acetoin/glycerol metabolism
LPLLIESLLRRLAPGATPRVDDDAMKLLRLYPFPGNIRELRNIMERARLFTDDGVIRAQDLPPEVRAQQSSSPAIRSAGRNDLESLAHALQAFDGSRSELAKHLGLSERTLYRRLKALGISG